MELRCVNCGARVRRLLVQYSPGNIRLMKCESCKAVTDPYVECELMILLIDLILHKEKAFRHLLFNMQNQDEVKMEMLLHVSSGHFMFFGFIFLSTRTLLNNQNSSIGITRFKGIVLAILLSSYFKIFLLAMMVWEFPSSVIPIIDIFVISSNAVALKVLTQLPTAACIGVLLGAHGVKFLASTWLQILSSTYS